MPLLLSAAAVPADPAVTTAVLAFASAGDARDIAAIEAATHPEFRVLFAVAGAPGVRILPRATYVQMAREGKVGGTSRAVEVAAVDLRGDLAWAAVTLESAAARFDSVMTLARVDGRWLVVEDATLYAPNAK
ncbi:MAG: nuclear transport factor 2 family protein [Pseudomonadota bacterium]|nr:nuclear transport factor 2 family protein [Pseudomonadota bacterium]